ncbi:MAG: CotH kinase family protein, partial [Planctomycetes bacterium]|nr:CotH kinase family protein [Planctomycetota bacterium]
MRRDHCRAPVGATIAVAFLAIGIAGIVGSGTEARGADVVINEFLAAGGGPLLDEDGEASDWIELRNASSAAIDLADWSLTDDIREPRKWIFPQTILDPGDFLVVFASERDRAKAGSPLHTNFKLEQKGEYLALIRPDGSTIEDDFAPRFPEQRYGISQGLATATTTLVAPEAAAAILVPADGSLGTAWTARAFVEGAGWRAGVTGIGYRGEDPGGTRIPPASAWTFDGDLSDSADGRDGSFTGGPEPAFVPGRDAAAGTAIRLDGTNDHVEIPATGIFPIYRQPAYTIAMWVKGLPQSDRRVYSEGSTQSNNPLFTMGTDNAAASGSVDIYIRTASNQVVLNHVKSVAPAFDGTWHHIVWVDEGGDARMYIDGNLDARDFRYTKSDIAFNKCAIGAVLRAAPSHWVAADIDDVAVWDVALDEDDIAALAGGIPPSGSAYDDLIRTDVAAAMDGGGTSLYARIPFEVDDPLAFDTLSLRVKYDDGFIAYLNGVEVARSNAPAGAGWDAVATAEHPPAQAIRYEDFNISAHAASLVPGRNVLAIHGLNAAADDGDFLLLPELVGASASAMVYRFSTTPTPGGPNADGYPGFVADTKFSVDRGLYDAPFDVEITTETPGAEIRYTTDATAPTATSGTIYTGPIRIDTTTTLRAAAFRSDLLPTNVDTHTYIYVADVPGQAAPAGYPTVWDGYAADYEMDPQITGAAAYRDMLLDGLRSLPSISVVVDPDHMFGPSGLYRNTLQSGSAWERPASIEYIDPDGGPEFQIDAGLRIQGGASRVPQKSPKHSLRLLFKSKYGASKLEFPLFLGSRVDAFDTITLRANYGNTWIHFSPTERRMAQYIHDQWARDAQIALGQPSARGTYVHLYVNGLYWGVYNPSERPDASYAAEHFGGTKLDYDAIQPEEVLDGTADAWDHLISLANAGVSSEAAYREIQKYLDVENLIDYMILNLYGGNWDWPHHNWYLIRKREAGAGFMFFSWDAEHVIESVNEDRSEADSDGSPARIHLRLRSNPEYRLLFADHVHRHLLGDGALTPEGAAGVFLARSVELDAAIVGESA